MAGAAGAPGSSWSKRPSIGPAHLKPAARRCPPPPKRPASSAQSTTGRPPSPGPRPARSASSPPAQRSDTRCALSRAENVHTSACGTTHQQTGSQLRTRSVSGRRLSSLPVSLIQAVALQVTQRSPYPGAASDTTHSTERGRLPGIVGGQPRGTGGRSPRARTRAAARPAPHSGRGAPGLRSGCILRPAAPMRTGHRQCTFIGHESRKALNGADCGRRHSQRSRSSMYSSCKNTWHTGRRQGGHTKVGGGSSGKKNSQARRAAHLGPGMRQLSTRRDASPCRKRPLKAAAPQDRPSENDKQLQRAQMSI